MEIKETGLDKKGRQRRALINFGVISALSAAASAAARALVGRTSQVEVEKEQFYEQAAAARRAKEAADRARKAEQAEQVQKFVLKTEPSREPKVSLDKQQEQFKKNLASRLGYSNFEVKIGPTGSYQVNVESGNILFIRSLPDVEDEETKISSFINSDKTPRSLGEVMMGNNIDGLCWEIFKLKDIIEQGKTVDVSNLDPEKVIDDPYWGKVVFACRLEYEGGEEHRYLELTPPGQ